MIVTYLDLATGRIAKDSGISVFDLKEGNWSCDCNRARAFSGINDSKVCDGCKQYIVIGVEKEAMDDLFDATEVVKEANREYYMRLQNAQQ